MLRCISQALNSLSIHVTFTAIVPGAYTGEAKMWLKKRSFAHENCQEPVTRHRYLAISQKWLKIDGYMLRGVWQALNSLSIHVTLTEIVPGEAKMCKKCAKMATFGFYGLNYWETVEDRWVHAAMRLTSIEFSFDPCNIYLDGPRGVGYPADARSVGDSHPSCSFSLPKLYLCTL